MCEDAADEYEQVNIFHVLLRRLYGSDSSRYALIDSGDGYIADGEGPLDPGPIGDCDSYTPIRRCRHDTRGKHSITVQPRKTPRRVGALFRRWRPLLSFI